MDLLTILAIVLLLFLLSLVVFQWTIDVARNDIILWYTNPITNTRKWYKLL